MNNQLILIGRIAELFNPDNTVKMYAPAKFILVSTDNVEYQMLLHLEERPFEYHAQALLQYMEENGLDNVYCFGGAKISLETTGKTSLYAKSYAFKTPNDEILEKVVKSIWPNAELKILTSDTKLTEAKLYTRGEVKYFAENP